METDHVIEGKIKEGKMLGRILTFSQVQYIK